MLEAAEEAPGWVQLLGPQVDLVVAEEVEQTFLAEIIQQTVLQILVVAVAAMAQQRFLEDQAALES
jgi:hypothetical protein